MEVGKQNKLNFSGVDIVNINVHVIHPLPKENPPPIDFTIIPKVFYPADAPEEFVILNEVKLVGKEFFNISILAFGFFSMPGLEGNIRDQKGFININAPAIMFPYLRAFVATLTANMGVNFAQILIPPHFFKGDMEEHIESPKEGEVPIVKDVKR